jgi:hypothetical protein
MAGQVRVLIDTCVWASFFQTLASREKEADRWLIRKDRAAAIGPVLSEVPLGIRNTAHAEWQCPRSAPSTDSTWTGKIGATTPRRREARPAVD